MSKPPKKLQGRPATDERGNSTWKWVGESGTEVETGLVRQLGEGLSLEGPPQNVVVDPYNQSTPQDAERPKGRSLDDMRRLNDQMRLEHEKLVKGLRKRTVGKSDSQPAGSLLLRFNDRVLLVDESHASITIGRAEDNDLVVTRERVSRLHARIEITRKQFVLIDQSANGTFVQTADGKEAFIHRGRVQLTGQGMIGFGRPARQGSPHTIHYEEV
jgi:hypothetical protein